MGIFSKKNDVVDLTRMKKQGLLPERKSQDEVMDLSSLSSSGKSDSDSNTSENLLGFSANFGSSESDQKTNYGGAYTARLREQRKAASEASDIKVKIENIEYKLERYLERLEAIEDKLGRLGFN